MSFETFLLTTHARDVRSSCELSFRGNGKDGPCLIRIFPHKPLFFVAVDEVLPPGIDAERWPNHRSANAKPSRGDNASKVPRINVPAGQCA